MGTKNNKQLNREGIIPLPKDEKESGLQLLKELKSESSVMKLLMAGVIIVLFIGLITVLIALAGILLDGWRFHSSSYNQFMQTLKIQERIIQNYTEEQKSIYETVQRIESDLKIIGEKTLK